MVNLWAYSLDFNDARGDATKERVILAAGALSRLSETWAGASPILREVKKVARDVFNAGSGNSSQAWNVDGDIQSIRDPSLDNLNWQDPMGDVWPDA